MKQARKHASPQEKVAVLRRHLLGKVAVSRLCQELGLHPSLFYHWLREFFEHGAAALDRRSRGDKQQQNGTFYYLCSVRDGDSHVIFHGDIRESMTPAEVEIILQRARNKFPGGRPRVTSDNGPALIARRFKDVPTARGTG
jgi:transposase-like protein